MKQYNNKVRRKAQYQPDDRHMASHRHAHQKQIRLSCYHAKVCAKSGAQENDQNKNAPFLPAFLQKTEALGRPHNNNFSSRKDGINRIEFWRSRFRVMVTSCPSSEIQGYYTPKTNKMQGFLVIFTFFVDYADFYVNMIMLTL